MKKSIELFISFALLLTLITPSLSYERENFVIDTPVMKVNEIKSGMIGEAHTVIKGEKIDTFKIKIVDILEKNSAPHSLILFKILDEDIVKGGGVASGMSGSPIYISGKLIGAIGYGWSFTDGSLGLATPIEEMKNAMSWEDKIPGFYTKDDLYKTYTYEKKKTDKVTSEDKKLKQKSVPLLVNGISPRMEKYMSEKLGIKVIGLGSRSRTSGNSIDLSYKPAPGCAMGVALLWGDIQAGAIGTLTATSRDGKFLAFGHPMMNKGQVAFPLTTAKILKIIPSMDNSFKLGTLGTVIGTVTQDRPEAIGGKLGVLPPVASYKVIFNDLDNHRSVEKTFKSIVDPFISPALATSGIVGIIEDEWARKGEGSVKMHFSVEGGNMHAPWYRENVFVSDSDALSPMLDEIETLTNIFATNKYGEMYPLGITVTADVTTDPMIASVEKIKIIPEKKEYLPGEKITAEVTIKPWRKEAYLEKLDFIIPEDVAQGICEVNIRAGESSDGDAGNGKIKLRAVNSFSQMLDELSSVESYNHLIGELRYNKLPVNEGKNDVLPEEFTDERLNSEKIKSKTEKGIMKINETDYVIKGGLSKFIKIKSVNRNR